MYAVKAKVRMKRKHQIPLPTRDQSASPGETRAKSHLAPWFHRFQFLDRDEGATLVETAVAYLVLLPLVFGTFGFSLAFYAYQDITDAARQAARWAAVRGSQSCANTPNLTDCDATPAQIQAFVQDLSYPGVVSSNLQVTTTWLTPSASTPTAWSSCAASPCNVPGSQVQVSVSYAFPLSIPMWRATTVNISSTGSMVVAQ
jgi:Flp pilus assembly protein TadG